MKLRKLSVTEVNNYAQKLLSYDPILQNLRIEGEISNFVAHSSGHAYFSLKDNESKINCIMFKRYFDETENKFKNGDKVDCIGDVSIYTKEGKLQLYVKEMKQAGIGELHIKFEELKKKYNKLGYFDIKNKKEIPKFPEKVAVITSKEGAALRDVISVFNRRTTLVNLLIYPVSVQGIYSKDEIVKALNYINDNGLADLIILTRGGGSIEELWSFNEPEVVESVFFSDIPIISGVGHETDYTLVDFVSDLRAPTPSAAAEIAIKSNEEIIQLMNGYKYSMNREIENLLNKNRTKLEKYSLEKLLLKKKNVIKEKTYLIDNMNLKLNSLINKTINNKKNEIDKLLINLNNNNPIEILKKGYSITEDENRNVITSIKIFKENQIIKTILIDGEIISKVEKVYGENYEK